MLDRTANPGIPRHRALTALSALALAPRAIGAQAAAVTLKAGVPVTETATPLLYAMRAGLFERAGIKIELTRMASGAAVASAIAGGAVDIGGTSLLALVLGHARGVPFTIVAAANNLWTAGAEGGLLVQDTSPLREAKDFSGKVISAAAVSDIVALQLWVWLDKNGGDAKAVKFLEIPQPVAAAALEQGRVDGSVLTGAAFANAKANPKLRAIPGVLNALAPRYVFTCWFSTRDWLDKNHVVAERFSRAMSEAAAYTNAHPDETLNDMLAFTGMDRAVALKMRRAVFTTAINPAEIQPLIDAAVKYKFIDKGYSATELISDVVPK
jgi:NitT/TauT family transport system substrate-binding protein